MTVSSPNYNIINSKNIEFNHEISLSSKSLKDKNIENVSTSILKNMHTIHNSEGVKINSKIIFRSPTTSTESSPIPPQVNGNKDSQACMSTQCAVNTHGIATATLTGAGLGQAFLQGALAGWAVGLPIPFPATSIVGGVVGGITGLILSASGVAIYHTVNKDKNE